MNLNMTDQNLQLIKEWKALKKDSACSFTMEAFSDHRQNKETVANLFSSSLQPTNLDSWLTKVQKTASKNTQRQNAKFNVVVKPRLLRLYTYAESLNINGVTAAELEFVVNGKTALKKHIRGFYGKTNWANGKGEYVTALNLSINNLVEQYKTGLNKVCDEITSNN